MKTTAWIAAVVLLAACGGGERIVRVRDTEVRPCPPCEEVAGPDESDVADTAPSDTSPLVADGIPEVPAAIHDRMQRWLETRSAFLESIADDGSAVLISTRFAETYQLHRLVAPMGARTQLTFLREPISAGGFVPGLSTEVVYTADVGGNEQYQHRRLEVATGRETLLSDGQSRNGPFAWSHDGTRLAWTSTARNGRDFDVYVSDGRTAESRQLFSEREGQWDVVEWSRDGTRMLLSEYISIVDSRFYVADVATRTVTRVTPPEPVAAYRDAVLSGDARKLYVTSDREGDFVELYELDLATGAFTPLSRGVSWNVEGIALSPDGRSLAYVTNEDGWSVLRVLDTRSRRARVVEGIPRGVLSELKFARRAPVLGFTHRSATRAGDVYTYDLRRRALQRWTESELGGLDPTRMVEPELVRYPSFDQRQIPSFVYRPRGRPSGTRSPVLIEIHGGPEAQMLPTFSPLRQYFVAEMGIAVLTPNVRGSDGYGKAYLRLDDGRQREDSVRDIGALLDWIATQPDLDPQRVAVYGASYGGYMTLASLVHYSDRLRAGIDSVGIANFVTFLENTAPYRRHLRRAEYGDESNPEMRAHLLSISPVTNVSRIRAALFVAHGANDPRVPVGEAEQIVRAVRANGHEVWYLLARNEGHGFAKKENRDAFQERMVMFLERQLLGAR